MAVVTLSRQLGSHGREIASRVATRLGYRFVWREMINEAARRAGEPVVALAIIDELNLFSLTPNAKAQAQYIGAVRQVMQELARNGDVIILGRAGQVILHDFPGALHVRVFAPFELRVQWVAAEQNIELAAAQEQVKASDRSRRHYMETYYGAKWDDPELYDLVINTAHVTTAEAVDLICAVINQRTSAQHALGDHSGTHS